MPLHFTSPTQIERGLEPRLRSKGDDRLLAGQALFVVAVSLEDACDRDLGGQRTHEPQIRTHRSHGSMRVPIAVPALQRSFGIHTATSVEGRPPTKQAPFVRCSTQAKYLPEGPVLQDAGQDGVAACAPGEVADNPP
nr:hypothetical protein [Blastococcus sp. TF02-8]